MARSTVFRYKGQEVDPQAVGYDLGVLAVMTGRVLHLGEHLIVKTELVNVTDGSQLWGEQYDRKLSDIFAVQAEISQEITEKLRLKLSGEQKKRLTKRFTNNAEAYQLYLKGRYFWNKRTPEGLKKGIGYFNQAIDRDPGYALAYAGLADSYALLSGYISVLPPKESWPKAKAAAMKALEIDETLAEAHTSLAYVTMSYDWDWARAEREFKRAIDLSPGYATAHHWYSVYLRAMGRFDESIAESERAQALDPLSLIINMDAGLPYYYARQYDRAIEHYRKTLEMDANFGHAHFCLGWAYEQKGLHEEAIAELQKASELSGRSIGIMAALGRALAVAGRRREAQEILGELEEISKQQYVFPYDMAIVYAGLGEPDQAFEWLGKAFAERDVGVIWIKVDPMLDSLRADVRFVDLLRRAGFTP